MQLLQEFQLSVMSFGPGVSSRSRVCVILSLDLNLLSCTSFACSLVSKRSHSSDNRSHYARVKEIWKRFVRKACVQYLHLRY
jgi:hypothetical protein